MTPLSTVRLIGEGMPVADFLLLTALPLVDFLGRPLAGFHIPGPATYTQQLTFFLAFIGGFAATLTGANISRSQRQTCCMGCGRAWNIPGESATFIVTLSIEQKTGA